MPYCHKCGKEVNEDDEFCSSCRSPLKGQITYRHVSRRDEKDEKNEKGEKNEKHEEDEYGSVIGGLVVILIGTLLFLSNNGFIRGGNFGGYFMLGLGVILIFRGLLGIQKSGMVDTAYGYLIGGGVVALIGAGVTYNIRDWWAFLLIGMGLVIIYKGYTDRNRNPIP